MTGRPTIRLLTPLLGAAVLAGFALASLPWSEGLLRRPRTPFDRSAARSVAPLYAILVDSRAAIPAGATVVARTEPPEPVMETYFHRFAISLLPGRRVLTSAFYGGFVRPEVWRDAQYMIVFGPRPVPAPGRLVLETPDGTVWRRQTQ